jgi:hypothetical protein
LRNKLSSDYPAFLLFLLLQKRITIFDFAIFDSVASFLHRQCELLGLEFAVVAADPKGVKSEVFFACSLVHQSDTAAVQLGVHLSGKRGLFNAVEQAEELSDFGRFENTEDSLAKEQGLPVQG